MNDEVINLEDEREPAPKYEIVPSKRYKSWLKDLVKTHKAVVNTEVDSLARGDFDGDYTKYKPLRNMNDWPVYELVIKKTKKNPAIRVYCYQHEETDTVIMLMYGGDKDAQVDDIVDLKKRLNKGDYDEYIPRRDTERVD